MKRVLVILFIISFLALIAVILQPTILLAAVKKPGNDLSSPSEADQQASVNMMNVTKNPGDLRIDHITEADGLSSRISYYLLKDHYGFIWIATNNGLDRFDGTDIKTFRNNGRDSLSLPKAEINSLFEDRSGRLW